MRHRRKARRYGPSPINGYTGGYGKTSSPRRGGLFSRVFGRKSQRQPTDLTDNSNALPEHTHPSDLHDNRDSYYGAAADPDALPPTHNQPVRGQQPMTGVNTGYGSYGYKPEAGTTEPGAYTHHSEYANPGPGGQSMGNTTTASPTPARYLPGNYRYDDGVYDRT